MIKLHREGRLIIIITIVVLLGIEIMTAVCLPDWANYPVSFIVLLILIVVFRFFRVPPRKPFLDDQTITAPADGTVVAIERVHQKEYLDVPCMQVSIFMSFNDVHINFFPVSGNVEYIHRHPGRYLIARHPKSSSLNERTSIGIRHSSGPILVRQIAGCVARRIRCYAVEGQKARQGSEMGFIKFGSRVDLFIPMEAAIQVCLNQKVVGSITPVARLS
jgi:phosphatidylserine decarboxylase